MVKLGSNDKCLPKGVMVRSTSTTASVESRRSSLTVQKRSSVPASSSSSGRAYLKKPVKSNYGASGYQNTISAECHDATFMQTRYKILSWLLNYTQSSERLICYDETQRGITTFRTFFLTAELYDFALQHYFKEDRNRVPPIGNNKDTRAWCIGLASFHLAIKIEENRNRFDYYDLTDLVNKEGPPPGVRPKKQWVSTVVHIEEELLNHLDWKISDVYANTTLGQLECILNMANIKDNNCSPTMTKRIQIAELVLQLASLLLPEWKVSGILQGSSCHPYINSLRAYGAWLLALSFDVVDDPNGAELIYSSTPCEEYTEKANDYLAAVLKDRHIEMNQFEEAISSSQSIQDHLKALLSYIIDFSTRMERNGCVDQYKNKKRVDISKHADTNGYVQSRGPHSFLIPVVSAHREILIDLANCSKQFSEAFLCRKLQLQEWLNTTFRTSLGYAIRCSNCLEYGHNKRFCSCAKN